MTKDNQSALHQNIRAMRLPRFWSSLIRDTLSIMTKTAPGIPPSPGHRSPISKAAGGGGEQGLLLQACQCVIMPLRLLLQAAIPASVGHRTLSHSAKDQKVLSATWWRQQCRI